MKVTTVKYERTFKVADYESAKYALEAMLEDDDTVSEAMAEMKAEVDAAHAGDMAETTKTSKKKTGKKAKPAQEEDEETPDDEETEEVVEDEEEPSDEDEEASEEDDSEEETEEEEKPAKKAAASTKKSKPKKPQNYDREVDQHKDIFSSKVISVISPKWKASDALKAKVKTVSSKMQGKPFLDADGNVLAEFKATVKKLMAVKK